MGRIRVIVTEVNSGTAIHVGGPVSVTHKTFDLIDADTISHFTMFMAEPVSKGWKDCTRFIYGIECLN